MIILMLIPGPFVLLILLLLSVVPAGVCALIARLDAKHDRRRLVRRVFTVACCLTLAALVMLLSMFLMLARQPQPAGVQYGVNWLGFVVAQLFIFIGSSLSGSLGYSLSYRIFRDSAPQGAYGGDAPVQRVEETGNPYQPPST